MQIRRLDFQDHIFQFTDGEYVMSHVTQKQLDVRVLRLETMSGHVGWGEIVRKPLLDQALVASQEAPLIGAIAGRDLADIPRGCREYRQRDVKLNGLAFGLETAYYDLIARRAGLPLYALLGGKLRDDAADYYSLSSNDSASVCARLAAAVDWKVIQVKLGVDDPQSDCEQVHALLSELANHQIMLVDFNAALDVPAALEIIAEFDDPRLVWEEPCKTVAENTLVAEQSGQAVMFDQCLSNLESFTRVVAAGLAHSVCIKPASLGGLEIARTARNICIDAGIPMRIDGPWCGHIASSVCLHLAVGVPADLLIAGCDLRQPLDIADDWGGIEHLPGHRIRPADSPGHGALPPP